MTVSVRGSVGHRELRETEPSFGASLGIIDLGRLIAARRQILAVRRETDATDNAEHAKWIVSPVIPATEAPRPPTFRGLECGPS